MSVSPHSVFQTTLRHGCSEMFVSGLLLCILGCIFWPILVWKDADAYCWLHFNWTKNAAELWARGLQTRERLESFHHARCAGRLVARPARSRSKADLSRGLFCKQVTELTMAWRWIVLQTRNVVGALALRHMIKRPTRCERYCRVYCWIKSSTDEEGW